MATLAINDIEFGVNATYTSSIIDAIFDQIDAGTKLYAINTLTVPANDTAAIAAQTAPALTISGADFAISAHTGPPKGRILTVATKDFSPSATDNGTAKAICITDGTNVLYTQALSADAIMTDGQTWTMPTFTVTITDYDAA